MKKMHVGPAKNCRKTVIVQGDKSISHRAIIMGSMAHGTTVVTNFLEAEDTLNTIKVYRALGVKIEKIKDKYYVYGRGAGSLRQSHETLDVGNSGTNIRLTTGVLAAKNFTSIITGDSQIVKRPMTRVMEPLALMGAKFESNQGKAPIIIHGGTLKGIDYKMPMASAQVKSAVLLAALGARGKTVIKEPVVSRDHTERMLEYFGAPITRSKGIITIKPGKEMKAKPVFVPGDISSAAYFIIAGLMMKNSIIKVRNVGLNPTRTGLIEVMKKMGGRIRVTGLKNKNNEPVGDIIAVTSKLKGITIGGAMIPKLIDEIPVIAVAAAFATGRTIIRDAKELRYKETDRIETIIKNLKRIGIKVDEAPDGMVIYGNNGSPFKYADIDSFSDHRLALAVSVAALSGENGLLIKDVECVNTSFPDFFDIMKKISVK